MAEKKVFYPKPAQLLVLQDIQRQKAILSQRENDAISMIVEFLDVKPEEVLNVELINNELIIHTK